MRFTRSLTLTGGHLNRVSGLVEREMTAIDNVKPFADGTVIRILWLRFQPLA